MDDASTERRRLGENVRRARRYRGLSLTVAAGLIGRSKGWLSMIENGRIALEKRSDIAALAEALEVSATDLLGQTASVIRSPRNGDADLIPLREVLLGSGLDDPPNVSVRPITAVQDEVDTVVREQWQTSDPRLSRTLPPLIAEVQVLAATGDEAQQAQALRLIVELCRYATAVVRWFNHVDLAWIAAERAGQAAARLDDPVVQAIGTWTRAHARPSAARDRALLGIAGTADDLERHLGNDRTAHEVYGMLRLSAALGCQVSGNTSGAEEHAAEAARVAARFGERRDAFGWFGPANVGVWQTMLAVEAGKPEIALEYANDVNTGALQGRRASLSVERARANAMLGQDAAAIAELRRAEAVSPAWLHNDPIVREVVANMLDGARREAGGRELRGLAWRMGVI